MSRRSMGSSLGGTSMGSWLGGSSMGSSLGWINERVKRKNELELDSSSIANHFFLGVCWRQMDDSFIWRPTHYLLTYYLITCLHTLTNLPTHLTPLFSWVSCHCVFFSLRLLLLLGNSCFSVLPADRSLTLSFVIFNF